MSIFVTSLGATDNEICAPFTHQILNTLNNKGFKFRGIPAVESRVLISTNKVCFALRVCNLRTQLVTFDFNDVYDFTSQYRLNRCVCPQIQSIVETLLYELEDLASNCKDNCHCSECVVTNRGPNPNKLAFKH
ncbi:hypothetical protein [Neptuniibacter sp. QD48_11]|uniref:hypothetical protein n=1 Tax=unclassified Neptuniibacter TaxID=2630693 RepID=UPI0039F517D0